jgi:hypothetical protein
MVYISRACGSALTPKILGTYEMELTSVVDEIVACKPDLVVDVGAAEGYYAVGMARRLPAARIVAFDTDRYARYTLGQLARANKLSDRIDVQGECTPQSLEPVLAAASTPLVICDCEGYEDQLLRPDLAPHLKQAIVLVELHEHQSRNVSQRIRDRFSATHRIVTVDSQARSAKDCPVATLLTDDELIAGLDEHRGSTMQWYAMFPQAPMGAVLPPGPDSQPGLNS